MNESVIGLRFVAQGETEARQAVERFNAAQTSALQLTRQMERASSQMESSVGMLSRQYGEGARNSQLYGNALREVKRQYAALTGGSIQQASAAVEKFSRALEAQKRTALDDSARQNYDRLVASLDPAIAAVQRFQQSMITLNTAQERGVISSREYAEVQTRLLQQLDASRVAADNAARQGFNRLAAELDPLSAATQRYEQRLAVLAEAEKRGQATAAETIRMRQRITQAYNAQVRELSGVANAEREAQRATQQAAETRKTAERGYEQLRAAIDPAVAAQQRFADAQRRVEAAVRAGIITQQQGTATLAAYRTTLGSATGGLVAADTAAGRVRAQLLATANSVAILDGPLGGIASRFSALGVLIGRTGLVIGGALVAFASFGALLNVGIRNLTQWEAQTARLNAVLAATGNQVGITSAAIQEMASSIALATLETEQGVRAAATRLLTFRDISGTVFREILESAADLAALGFGTIESETTKLAKALEDPAQALTSLSRAGIVFTRQQRSVIIALVESGQRAEAMERILQNVRARTEGAAQAAASGTLAGAFDTIGQAVGRSTREFAAFILEITGANALIQRIAANVSDYAAGPDSLATRTAAARDRVKELREELQRAQITAQNPFVQSFGTAALSAGERLPRGVQAELDIAEERLQLLRAELKTQEDLARAQQATARIGRDREGLDNLRAEIDLRTQALVLSSDETRVQKMLAQEGLRNLDIQQRITALREGLAGVVDPGLLAAAEADYRRELEDVANVLTTLIDLGNRERAVRGNEAATENLREQNDTLFRQLNLMEQGVEQSRARERAERDILIARLEQDALNPRLTQHERDMIAARVDELRILYDVNRAIERQAQIMANAETLLERILRHMRSIRDVDLAKPFASAITSAETFNNRLLAALGTLRSILGAIGSISLDTVGIQAETAALRAGQSRERAAIAGQMAQIEAEAMQSGPISPAQRVLLDQQRAALNARQDALAERERALNDPRRNAPPGRPFELGVPDPARSGGGGGATQELATLQSITAEMLVQIERESELLRLQGTARRERELFYDITERLRQQGSAFSEEAVMQAAARIAAREQEREQLQRMEDDMQRLAQTMESALTDGFMSIVDGTKTASQAFKDMARQIIAELFRVLVVQQLVGQFKTGGGGILGSIAGAIGGGRITASANGNIFASGNVVPFANGGVVSRPSLFPMGGGQTGLMGEAGPEAIMPLKRGRDGKLGVAADGGGAVSVTVNMNVSANGDESIRKIVAQAAPQIVEAAKAGVLDARRRGGQFRAAFGGGG